MKSLIFEGTVDSDWTFTFYTLGPFKVAIKGINGNSYLLCVTYYIAKSILLKQTEQVKFNWNSILRFCKREFYFWASFVVLGLYYNVKYFSLWIKKNAYKYNSTFLQFFAISIVQKIEALVKSFSMKWCRKFIWKVFWHREFKRIHSKYNIVYSHRQ